MHSSVIIIKYLGFGGEKRDLSCMSLISLDVASY